MKIYLIEDEEFGITGAFLHESAANDALDLNKELYNPSGKSPSILEFQVYTSKRIIEYSSAKLK